MTDVFILVSHQELDFEVELTIVIGKKGKKIPVCYTEQSHACTNTHAQRERERERGGGAHMQAYTHMFSSNPSFT